MTRRSAMRNVPDELAEKFTNGETILIVSRFSGESGAASRRQAVDDLLGAADSLATYGVDIRDRLESPAVLQEMLRRATPHRSEGANGSSFTNRYVTLDLRIDCGVMVLLSIGSGAKLNADYAQPFVEHAAELVRRVKPCLFFAKRIDRMTRSAWSLAPVMLFLSESEGFIGDADRGIRQTTGTQSIEIFFTAQAGEAEARKLPKQTRNGMVRRTGPSLSSPPCPYAVGHIAPPGLMTYRQRNRGQQGDRVITFETPNCVPPHDQVAYGLPEVYKTLGDKTNIVDQVANVRWALARLGQPDWDHKKIAQGLAARSFSSEGIRRTRGPAAVLPAELATKNPARALRTILDNIDFYETGSLQIELGVDGFKTMTIEDGFPPDGQPWATVADFARIREWMRRSHRPAPRRTVMSGLPIVVNGEECVLTHRSGRTPAHASYLRAVKRTPWKESRAQQSTGHVIVLDPNTIPDMFAEAVANAGDAALTLVSHPEDTNLAIEGEIQAAEARLAVLQRERDELLASLTQRADDGTPLITGALLKTLNQRFNEIEEDLLPKAALESSTARERLASERQALLECTRAVEVQQLLALIAGLRDPYDTSNTELFGRSIRNLRVNVERHEAHRHVWRYYTIEFEIIIAADGGEVLIPAKRQVTYGDPYNVPKIAMQIIDALCDGGTTYSEINPRGRHNVLPELAQALQVSSLHFKLPNVTDPRLAQLVAMVLRWPDELEALSNQTGETVSFLKRLHTVHAGSTCGRWIGKATPRLARWFLQGLDGPIPLESVSATDLSYLRSGPTGGAWETNANLLEIARCAHCHSRRRVPARIPEPLGLVCLDCSKDESAVEWPMTTYAQFLLL